MTMTAVSSMAAPQMADQPMVDAPVSERPRRKRSIVAWEATKVGIAVAAFAGMLLPAAFPSKASTQAKVAQLPIVEAPPAPVKVQSQKAAVSASSSSPLKANPVPPPPAKKPAPKNT